MSSATKLLSLSRMITCPGVCVRVGVVCALAFVIPVPAAAQSEHDHMNMTGGGPSWDFSWDARVFTGWNYQYRKYRDFQRVESQNWFMAEAQRPVGTGHVRFNGMIS